MRNQIAFGKDVILYLEMQRLNYTKIQTYLSENHRNTSNATIALSMT